MHRLRHRRPHSSSRRFQRRARRQHRSRRRSRLPAGRYRRSLQLRRCRYLVEARFPRSRSRRRACRLRLQTSLDQPRRPAEVPAAEPPAPPDIEPVAMGFEPTPAVGATARCEVRGRSGLPASPSRTNKSRSAFGDDVSASFTLAAAEIPRVTDAFHSYSECSRWFFVRFADSCARSSRSRTAWRLSCMFPGAADTCRRGFHVRRTANQRRARAALV